MTSRSVLAFGITAAKRPHLDRLGAEVERLGYAELWSNDTLGGDGLATLEACLPDTERLVAGVGAIALSERGTRQIAEAVRASSIPSDRLVLGVGSGGSGSLSLVRESVAELRQLLAETAIAVAAVGPRMTRLGGEIADAVVFNWSLPERLARAREIVAEGASAAERPTPRVVAYVRTAIGPDAVERLRAEMDRYRSAAHYAAAFDAQGGRETLIGIALDKPTRAVVAEALAPYRLVVDVCVVRALPVGDTASDWLQVARAAAPSGPTA
jgi:alkanesulfonate monooxygenase SsuD/methylene tetrahydromethanopterin reductase-like flavin-dependent oxidoreductase (luciferase family)